MGAELEMDSFIFNKLLKLNILCYIAVSSSYITTVYNKPSLCSLLPAGYKYKTYIIFHTKYATLYHRVDIHEDLLFEH